MYFSQAFITALSLSAAAQAMPVRHNAHGQQARGLSTTGSDNFNKLHIRGAPAEIIKANMLFGRAPAPELADAADQIQALVARQSSSSGSMTSVLQVLSCLLDVILGRGTDSCTKLLGNSTGNSTANATAASRKQLAGMLTDLSGLLSKSSQDLAATAKKEKADKQKRGLVTRDDTSINEVLGMLNNLGQLVQKLMSDLTTLGLRQQEQAEGGDGDDGSSPTDDPTEDPNETSVPTSSADPSATDAKTEAPSTDAAPTATATSAADPEKTSGGKADCPSPHPNDGMYRPGCPGYGRRDLAKRDASQEQLKQVLPALSTLIEAIPGLLTAAGTNGTSANATDAAAGNSTAAKDGTSSVAANLTELANSNSYKKVVKQLNSAIQFLNNGTATDSTADAKPAASGNATSTTTKESSSSADAPADSDAASRAAAQSHKADTAADSRQAVAASTIKHGSRDLSALLEGDGFRYVRRANGDSDASQANNGGINVDLLNNLLNGLLSSRDLKEGAGVSKADLAAVNRLFSQVLAGHAK